jgi:hypothetical protein
VGVIFAHPAVSENDLMSIDIYWRVEIGLDGPCDGPCPN